MKFCLHWNLQRSGILFSILTFCIVIGKNHQFPQNTSNISQCLPSFLIAGTQKSGTTVLAAFLSEQPTVGMASKKEIHFFDKTASYNKGIETYQQSFRCNGRNTTHKRIASQIYGEATPFYVASRLACKRIAKHIPNVKMIVLIRNPIKRAYSEYHMKKRRVDQQSEFFDLMSKHVDAVYHCLTAAEQVGNTTELRECAPSEVGGHPRWVKFRTALSKLVDKYAKAYEDTSNNSDRDDSHQQQQAWLAAANTCFPLRIPLLPLQSHANRVCTAQYFNDSSCIAADEKSVGIGCGSGGDTAGYHGSGRSAAVTMAQRLLTSQRRRLLFHRNESSSRLTLQHQQQQQKHSTATISPAVSTDAGTARMFDYRTCWREHLQDYEEVRTVQQALVEEVEQFKLCGGDKLADIMSRQYDTESTTEEGSWLCLDCIDSM